MSEEKQIEEMAKDIFECKVAIDGIDIAFAAVHGANQKDSHFIKIAEHLVINKGYRKQSDWISVDERLPEKTGLYLIVWDGSVAAAYRHTHWTLGEFWNNDLDGGISVIPDSEVTHWMPLPEPPEMKGE